jgi:hypothetical protein
MKRGLNSWLGLEHLIHGNGQWHESCFVDAVLTVFFVTQILMVADC